MGVSALPTRPTLMPYNGIVSACLNRLQVDNHFTGDKMAMTAKLLGVPRDLAGVSSALTSDLSLAPLST